jgi:archaellum component FlaC
MANSRYKFNNTTRKMDDLSPAEIEDKIDAIEGLEEGINNDSMYAISEYFSKIKNEMNLLESCLKNARSEELQEYLNEFMNVRIGFDSLYKKFEDFDNKHFGR